MQNARNFCYLALLTSSLTAAALLALTSNLALAASGEPQASLRVEPPEFYEGESALLVLSVTNARPDKSPVLEELEKDFVVETLTSSTQSSVRIINGSREESRTIDYRFRLTPKHAGTFTINSPEIIVEGKPLNASPVTVTVREQTTTDLVAIEVVANPSESIYPLVPFDVSVNVFIKAYPEKYKEYDPLALIVHNLSAPQLSVPWLESTMFEDVVVAEPLDDWLEALSSNDYGFALNNYRLSGSVFDFGLSFFDEPVRKSFFLPKPQEVERKDASGANVKYWKYSFTRKMRATIPSKLSFAPATLKGAFLDFTDSENPVSRSVFLSTPPIEIQIKNIPEEDAPDDYLGVYGKISQKATLSSQEASVGDALTLSLEYTGYGSFTTATAPDFSDQEGIKGVFRVYPASERSIDSGVVFDYKLRPLKEGSVSIPAIRTSFFNVETGQFEPMISEAIPVRVREGVLTEDEDELNKDVAETTSRHESGPAGEETILKRQRQFKRFVAVVLSIVAAATALVLLFFVGRSALRANAQRIASSNRRILESARKTLNSGLTKLDIEPYEGFSQIRLAFLQLVAKRLPRSLDSYTDAEIQDFLEHEFAKDAGKEPKFKETLEKIKEFLLQSEKFRFGGKSSLDANIRSNVTSLFDGWTEILLSRTRKLSHLSRDPMKK